MTDKKFYAMTITAILILSTFAMGDQIQASQPEQLVITIVDDDAVCTIIQEGDCGRGSVIGQFKFRTTQKGDTILAEGRGSFCIFPKENGPKCAFELESQGPLHMEYDPINRLTTIVGPFEEHIGHMSYTYDANGNQSGWQDQAEIELESSLTGEENGIEIKIDGTGTLKFIGVPPLIR